MPLKARSNFSLPPPHHELNRLQPSMLRLTDHIAGASLFTRVYEGIPLLKANLVWGAASNTTCFERRPAPVCNMPVPQRGCGPQSGAEMDFGSGFKARGHNQESHKKEQVSPLEAISVRPRGQQRTLKRGNHVAKPSAATGAGSGKLTSSQVKLPEGRGGNQT